MKSEAKRTYVLIAGAWHGGWAWRQVAPILRALGHDVSAPTLSGLGERSQNASQEINLTTHIDDVIAHIKMEGLEKVTLVGWSYGGMVISGVATRIPEKIESMIYVDGFVPESGKALVDYLSETGRAALEELKSNNQPIPPMPLELFGVTEAHVIEFVTPRLVHQPWQTFFEEIGTLHAPPHIAVGFIHCSATNLMHFKQTYEKMRARREVRTAEINTGHLCMLSEPEQTAKLLATLL